MRESYGGLSKAYKRLVEEARREHPLTPAANWLLDNFYVIRDAARQLRNDLPFAYYRVLLKLEGGVHSGRPRIYEAVSGLAERTDNVLNEQHLWGFFSAFQEVSTLRMSELWALPAMARLVLVQRLSVFAAQVSDTLEEQDEAVRWARQIIDRATEDPADMVFVLAEMSERHAPLPGSFVVMLTDTLRAEGAIAAPALDWLERTLATRGLTSARVRGRHTLRVPHLRGRADVADESGGSDTTGRAAGGPRSRECRRVVAIRAAVQLRRCI